MFKETLFKSIFLDLKMYKICYNPACFKVFYPFGLFSTRQLQKTKKTKISFLVSSYSSSNMNSSCKINYCYEFTMNFNTQKGLTTLIFFIERLENSIKSSK